MKTPGMTYLPSNGGDNDNADAKALWSHLDYLPISEFSTDGDSDVAANADVGM